MNPWCDELLKFYTDMLNGIAQSATMGQSQHIILPFDEESKTSLTLKKKKKVYMM